MRSVLHRETQKKERHLQTISVNLKPIEMFTIMHSFYKFDNRKGENVFFLAVQNIQFFGTQIFERSLKGISKVETKTNSSLDRNLRRLISLGPWDSRFTPRIRAAYEPL